MSAFLICGLATAHAGQRQHGPMKHRYSGPSFSVHVGGSVRRHVSHMPHRQAVVRVCSPHQASAFARVYGIRYQSIYRNARTMTVVGYRNGHRARISFSREPDCHIVR